MKPDYRRIAELERDIFGQALTAVPVIRSHDLDVVVRDVAVWLLTGRGAPEFDGSKVATAGRLVVLGILSFAGLWLCLMFAGVVPWTS